MEDTPTASILPLYLEPIANQTVNEGQTFNVGAQGYSAVEGTALTYSLDPGAPAGTTIDQSTGIFAWTPGNGPQTVSVTVRVTDNESPPMSATQSFVIKVINVPPTVTLASATPVPAGAAFSDTGIFTDPGTQDSWTATVDYGDGSGSQPQILNADKTFALDHVYASAGTYPVIVAVTDSGDGVGTSALTETVTQANTMTAIAGSVTSPVYGQSVTFSASVGAVAPGSGMPTGTIQFEVDGSNLGTPVDLVNGSATSIATAALGAGTHSIAAVYSGDDNFVTSTAEDFPLSVAPAPLTITADSESKTYGQALAFVGDEFTTYGLVNSDSVTSVTLTSTAQRARHRCPPYRIPLSPATRPEPD